MWLFVSNIPILILELLGCSIGCSNWAHLGRPKKLLTVFLGASFALGVTESILRHLHHTNAWCGHLWSLFILFIFGPFLISRVRYDCRDFSVALLVIGFMAWMIGVFNYGFNSYHIGGHLCIAIFGFISSLASRDSNHMDYALACAFACDIYICCISLWWHHVYPAYWIVRNLVLAYALYRISRAIKIHR